MGEQKRKFKRRDVSLGTFEATEEMKNNVMRVLETGRLSYDVFSKEYEMKFAEIHDTKYGVLSNSGTSALQVALQAMKEIHGWEDGDEVIVPATTFVATLNIVVHNRLVPVLVDVDSETYNIDVTLIEDKITEKTRAIIPVHLFGQPADMTAIAEIAGNYGLKIIEDSCECMFVKHKEFSVGSMGDIGCFSTYVAHLVVSGVGGMCTTDNPEYACKMRSLVNHGLSYENLNMDRSFSPQRMVGRSFKFDSCGHSARITELEAAIALPQLDNYKQMLKIRKRNALHLSAGINILCSSFGNVLQTPLVDLNCEHAWMVYPIVMTTEASKTDLIAFLNNRGIETRDMMPILSQPFYEYHSYDEGGYPVSEWLVRKGFYVGCHQALTPEDIQYTIDMLAIYFDSEINHLDYL